MPVITQHQVDSKLSQKISSRLLYLFAGHIASVAQEVKAGLEAGGCDVVLCRAPELLSAEVLEKM